MAVRHRLVTLVLATLFAATVASADIVITTSEVISCTVVLADTNYVRLRLPQGSIRMLATADVFEVRLPDSGRVAEFSSALPGTKVVLDSGQYIPSPRERATSATQQGLNLLSPGTESDALSGRTDGMRDGRASPATWGWFAGSFLVSGLAVFGGARVALAVWGVPNPYEWDYCTNCALASLGSGVGWLLGLAGPVTSALSPPTPPPAKLLGKSSSYVAVYTSAYANAARPVQAGLALLGWLTGGVAGTVLALAVMPD